MKLKNLWPRGLKLKVREGRESTLDNQGGRGLPHELGTGDVTRQKVLPPSTLDQAVKEYAPPRRSKQSNLTKRRARK